MTIIESEKLFKILKLTRKELFSIGGYSICDQCCKPITEGYYISVLNQTYCKEHYDQWIKDAVNYPEDHEYENFTFKRMIQLINNNSNIKGL